MLQAALVSLPDPDSRTGPYEARQAMAIAQALPESGMEPLLVCREAVSGIPSLAVGKKAALLDLFKLWRWQHGHEKLLIIALGSGGLKLARRLYGMAKKRGALLAGVFLLEAPEDKKGLERASLNICGSEFIARELDEKTTRIASPGIDLEAFSEYAAQTRQKRFIFGLAESLVPESGALLVVRAMAALWQHSLPDWEVRMFGNGPAFAEVLAEAEKMGVSSRLGIFGDQPLPYVASQCHAWLAPGSAPNELPDTLWAGFAAAIPVISSTSQLHLDRLFHRKAALMVSSDNPQELARTMLSLIQDREVYRTMTEAGQELLPMISLQGMASRVCSQLASLI